MTPLEQTLGYVFHDQQLLTQALTHPSGKRQPGQASPYERLEFLGDRVLSLLIAEWLFDLHPNAHEGDLARRHADLVSRDSVAEMAETLNLFESLILSPGERISLSQDSGRGRRGALANAGESLIAAVYRDGGLDAARDMVRRLWQKLIDRQTAAAPQDSKSRLQEWAQARGWPLPVYEALSQEGPPHAPIYRIRVRINGHDAQGEGTSKHIAQQAAAAAALEHIKGSTKA
ncbi:MAG: ribonuclease III [Alphaproteobacteria bacterium]|nr:MAG: ribonuclease III [Alphaproteobacteria bacterium]